MEDCRAVSENGLKFFTALKLKIPGQGTVISSAEKLKTSIRALQEKLQVCY